MPETDRRHSRARRILGLGLASLTCAWVVMWLSSYSFFTSLGLDHDRVEGAQVRYTYLRARWPGDGSFRMGGGGLLRPLEIHAVEPFDLGGRFFKPPRRSVPRTFWNRLGFWWLTEPSEQDEAQNTWVFWVGIPSWLPALLTGVVTVPLVLTPGPLGRPPLARRRSPARDEDHG